MPGAPTLRVPAALILALVAACAPEGQSVEWPAQAGLGFLVGLDGNGVVRLPIQGPFDLSGSSHTFAKSDVDELYLVATQLDRVARVEARWAPDPTTLQLIPASSELGVCPQGFFERDGRVVEHPVGREDEVELFRLDSNHFVAVGSSPLLNELAWQMLREARCPQALVTKTAPFAESIEYVTSPGEPGPDTENQAVVILDSNRALAVTSRWIHLLERGRAEPVARLWADAPEIPEPLPSAGRSFEKIARLPIQGDEDARILVAGTLHDSSAVIREDGWFLVELTVWPNTVRYERTRLHERRAGTSARALATSVDGEILAAADRRVFWAGATTSTVWDLPSNIDPRAALILESHAKRHVIGGEDGDLWFGDMSLGVSSLPSMPSFSTPGFTPNVNAITEIEGFVYVLTNRSLSRGVPEDAEFEVLPRDLPPDAAPCASPNPRNRCGRQPFPEKSVGMHADDRGILMSTTFCDAAFLRHPDGCIDTVPLVSDPEVRRTSDEDAHPRHIIGADGRWLITVDHARLYEVSVEGDTLE